MRLQLTCTFFSGKASQTRFEDESVAPCCERLVIKPEVCLFIPDYFLLVDSCGPGILEDLKCKILEHCSPVDAITHDDQYFHCADAIVSVEFRNFLNTIEENVPEELDVHLIMDHYETHKRS
jgi:hypothetical protein